MTGRRVEPGRQRLLLSVAVAMLVLGVTAVLLLHDIGGRNGQPHVVPLQTPGVTRTSSSAAP